MSVYLADYYISVSFDSCLETILLSKDTSEYRALLDKCIDINCCKTTEVTLLVLFYLICDDLPLLPIRMQLIYIYCTVNRKITNTIFCPHVLCLCYRFWFDVDSFLSNGVG
jgi:hypothetical protein